MPKLKPILVGIVYRPPDQSVFLNKLSSSIANAKSFDLYEAYGGKVPNLYGHVCHKIKILGEDFGKFVRARPQSFVGI